MVMIKANAPVPVQPPTLPADPPGLFSWAKYFSEFATRELNRRPATGTAVDSALLVSPNGSVYTVRVTDAGALVTELVRGP